MTAEQFYLGQVQIGNAVLLSEYLNDYDDIDPNCNRLKELFFLMDNYASFKNGMAGISAT